MPNQLAHALTAIAAAVSPQSRRPACVLRFGETLEDSRIAVPGWARGVPDAPDEVLTPAQFAERYPDGAVYEAWTAADWRGMTLLGEAGRDDA